MKNKWFDLSKGTATFLRHEAHDLKFAHGGVPWNVFMTEIPKWFMPPRGENCPADTRTMLRCLGQASDKQRYEIARSLRDLKPDGKSSGSGAKLVESYADSDPLFIRTIQGESGHLVELKYRTHVRVTAEEVSRLYHNGFEKDRDAILEKGLIPGGFKNKKSPRQENYFSIMHPSTPPKKNYYIPESEPEYFDKITFEVYPYSQGRDACYVIDVAMAEKMGCRFYQTPSYTVLCQEPIPPEAIMYVEELGTQRIYGYETKHSPKAPPPVLGAAQPDDDRVGAGYEKKHSPKAPPPVLGAAQPDDDRVGAAQPACSSSRGVVYAQLDDDHVGATQPDARAMEQLEHNLPDSSSHECDQTDGILDVYEKSWILVGSKVWRRYEDPNHSRIWFCCEETVDGGETRVSDWFWPGASEWAHYLDPATQRKYWYKSDDCWFYED
jgi:hypothetical protein